MIRRRRTGISTAPKPLPFFLEPTFRLSCETFLLFKRREGERGGGTSQISALPPVPPSPVQPVPPANANSEAHPPNFSPDSSPSSGPTAAQMENSLSLHRKFQGEKKLVGLTASPPPFLPPRRYDFRLQGREGGGGFHDPTFYSFS